MAEFVFTAGPDVDGGGRAGAAQVAGETLTDLATWIQERTELDARVTLRTRPPRPGELGGVADAVEVIAAATPLAKVVLGWLTERTKNSRVSLKIGRTGGGDVTVEIEAGEAATQDLIKNLRTVLAEDGDGD